jgi:hypothetical protein
MVVKPLDFIVRGRRGLTQPAVPRAFEQFQPELSVYHTKLYLHIVSLNANAFSSAL